jgi:ABC-2 type transport system permease protein
MWQILQIELFKIFKRPRTYISFIAIASLVMVIQLALYVDGESYITFGMQSLSNSLSVDGKKLTGFMVCYIVLQLLLVHVPLLIALVAGDLVSGEANMGTLRLLITRPVSRVQLMLVKFSAGLIYSMMLLVWMAFLALLVSLFIFGHGDLIVMKSDTVSIISEKLLVSGADAGKEVYINDMMWRFYAAFLYAAIAMATVASLSFLLSVFAENSIGPIIATMSIIVVFTIISTMDIPFFRHIHPFLFTTHMVRWRDFFDYPNGMDVETYQQTARSLSFFGKLFLYKETLASAGILLLHVVLFTGTGILVFWKKDIKT